MSQMTNEVKMIYIQMLDEWSYMDLPSDQNHFRNQMFYKYHGNSTSAGVEFAKKIVRALIKTNGCNNV